MANWSLWMQVAMTGAEIELELACSTAWWIWNDINYRWLEWWVGSMVAGGRENKLTDKNVL